MQDADRPEFERLLRELFGALDKPLTEHQRNAFWKGLARMSLTEFERCCDHILRELEGGEPPRRFGVDSIWAARQQLRASAPPEVSKPRDDGFRCDRWDIAANRHLLAYLVRQICERRRGLNAEAVQTLIEAKHRWAATMRDIDAGCGGHGVPVEDQRDIWRECMRQAEDEIRARQASDSAQDARTRHRSGDRGEGYIPTLPAPNSPLIKPLRQEDAA